MYKKDSLSSVKKVLDDQLREDTRRYGRSLSTGEGRQSFGGGRSSIGGRQSVRGAGGRLSYLPTSVRKPPFKQLTNQRLSTAGPSGTTVASTRRSGSAQKPRSSEIMRRYSAAYTTNIKKDPRPIRTPEFKKACERELLEFLAEKNYPHELTLKLIKSPRDTDFFNMFEFIYGLLGLASKFSKRDRDSIPGIFKQLGYPFQITKSNMVNVGSPVTWPSILAALVWLKDEVQTEEIGDIEHILEPEKQIWMSYMESSMESYLNGKDDFSLENEILEKKLLQFDIEDDGLGYEEAILRDRDLEIREEDLQVKRQKINEELAHLNAKMRNYASDIEAATEFKIKLQTKIGEYQREISVLDVQLQNIELDMFEKEEELKRKQLLVSQQTVSKTELDQMKTERHTLDQQHERLAKQIDDMRENKWKEEMERSRRLDKLNTKQQRLNEVYNELRLRQALTGDEKEEMRLHNCDEAEFKRFENRMIPIRKKGQTRVEQEHMAAIDEEYCLKGNLTQFENLVDEKKQALSDLTEQIARHEANYKQKLQLSREQKKSLQIQRDALESQAVEDALDKQKRKHQLIQQQQQLTEERAKKQMKYTENINLGKEKVSKLKRLIVDYTETLKVKALKYEAENDERVKQLQELMEKMKNP